MRPGPPALLLPPPDSRSTRRGIRALIPRIAVGAGIPYAVSAGEVVPAGHAGHLPVDGHQRTLAVRTRHDLADATPPRFRGGWGRGPEPLPRRRWKAPDEGMLLTPGEHLAHRFLLPQARVSGPAANPSRSNCPESATLTPLAAAIRPASRTNPSETSMSALAPASAAATPARRGGRPAVRWAHMRVATAASRSSRSPRPAPAGEALLAAGTPPAGDEGGTGVPAAYKANPPPEKPKVPHTATTSPTRAPLRNTGERPCRSPSAVTETTTTPAGADDKSPPTTATSASPAAAASPPVTSRTHATSVSGSAANETSSAVGTAPMAATSARFWATTLRPTSAPLDQSSRQSRPRTIESVVATTE